MPPWAMPGESEPDFLPFSPIFPGKRRRRLTNPAVRWDRMGNAREIRRTKIPPTGRNCAEVQILRRSFVFPETFPRPRARRGYFLKKRENFLKSSFSSALRRAGGAGIVFCGKTPLVSLLHPPGAAALMSVSGKRPRRGARRWSLPGRPAPVSGIPGPGG